MNLEHHFSQVIDLIRAKDFERAEQGLVRLQEELRKSPPLRPRSNKSNDVVGIFVGHSRLGDRGAVSVGGVAEWTYNRVVATELMRALHRADLTVELFWAYKGGSYGSAMAWLAEEAPKHGVTVGVELHFNSGGGTGHEVLCWNADQDLRSTRLAKSINTAIAQSWPEGANRGVKSAVRGRGFLSSFEFPAVIVEPFFGDHQGDWDRWKNAQSELAGAIANGIVDFLL